MMDIVYSLIMQRLPLNIALTPNYELRPQPVPLGIGTSNMQGMPLRG